MIFYFILFFFLFFSTVRIMQDGNKNLWFCFLFYLFSPQSHRFRLLAPGLWSRNTPCFPFLSSTTHRAPVPPSHLISSSFPHSSHPLHFLPVSLHLVFACFYFLSLFFFPWRFMHLSFHLVSYPSYVFIHSEFVCLAFLTTFCLFFWLIVRYFSSHFILYDW